MKRKRTKNKRTLIEKVRITQREKGRERDKEKQKWEVESDK